MDVESPSTFQGSPESVEVSQVVIPLDQSRTSCTMCGILFSPDNAVNDLEPLNMCGDCKFLFVEDLGTNMQSSHQRRPFRRRRASHSSFESVSDLFSHQFSHIINLARQNEYSTPLPASEQEIPLVDGETAARMLQHTNSCTTPGGSRSWHRPQSDSGSEVFDNLDSTFGESESNVSLGGYGTFHGESDTVSYSAYGGESDVSIDGHSFVGREMFNQPDDGMQYDSDTDIDPMHAGHNQWNSDDQDEEDSEWEEASTEENLVENIAEQWAESRSPSENNGSSYWLRRLQAPESRGSSIHGRIGETRTYLNGRDLELLEQFAEAESSRRGAPPAAAAFRDDLPCVVINEGGLVCAVCKDPLSVGTEVNQLPCMHLYHPCCIYPWLSARNTCPLCRFELPTDDKDYEERKQNSRGVRIGIEEVEQDDDPSGESSDNVSDAEADGVSGRSRVNLDCATAGGSNQGHTRGGWFLLAATPVISFVALAFWFRNPRRGGGHGQFAVQGEGQVRFPSWGSATRRNIGGSRNRRWWSIY